MILSFCGFGSALVFKDICDDDIAYIQNFVRSELSRIVELTFDAENDNIDISWIFGAFSSEPSEFMFLPDEKKLVTISVHQVKRIVDNPTVNGNLGHFVDQHIADSFEDKMHQTTQGFIFDRIRETKDIENAFEAMKLDEVPVESANSSTLSRTHNLLLKLLALADENIRRDKPGYRYDSDIKTFATYLRLMSGCYAYETLQKNLELCLPSLSSTNRYVRQLGECVIEGQLRTRELVQYLAARGLEPVVAISEDATRIDGRIQYSSKLNQIMGFSCPIDAKTGMPIPLSYPARSAEEMFEHFSDANLPAHFANVVMAQPLANFPPFCVLFYASNARDTAENVNNRWSFITKELADAHIHVLTDSADSDQKFNSAMRMRSMLGSDSSIFGAANWFCSGLGDDSSGPFDFQDIIHIATKLRNLFLKTGLNPRMLKFGKFFIQMSHLVYLLNNIPKDQHFLTAYTLNPVDRQNFESVMRMCDDKVVNLLRDKVEKSDGTVAFLMMIRDVVSAFSRENITPLNRVKKIFYSVFLMRIWRQYVVSQKNLTLKKNFLTQNCYACVEINAHNLVHVLLYLKRIGKKEWFMPFLFNSQACEGFFRQLRSFTTTYSTVANCSVKEMLGRIKKIELLSDISTNRNFVFPRMRNTHQFPESVAYDLPTKEEIFTTISECQKDAIKYAIKIGLLKKNCPMSSFPCAIPTLVSGKNKRKRNRADFDPVQMRKNPFLKLNAVQLKNYDTKFENQNVPETSSYVEVFTNTKKRLIVKKTSLCWLLRKDQSKLSSDRLLRVRAPVKPNKHGTIKRPAPASLLRRKTPKRYGLLYRK